MTAWLTLHTANETPVTIDDFRTNASPFVSLGITNTDLNIRIHFHSKTEVIAWLSAALATVAVLPEDTIPAVAP